MRMTCIFSECPKMLFIPFAMPGEFLKGLFFSNYKSIYLIIINFRHVKKNNRQKKI